MLTRIMTASLIGVSGYKVIVEVDIRSGIPSFNVVGLADVTIREAARRIKPAMANSGYRYPADKITVNLVPAGKAKEGSHFDLPIAMGIILSSISCDAPDDIAFFGELSLDGRVNRIRGALPLALSVRAAGIRKIVLPSTNKDEVFVLADMDIYPVDNIEDAVKVACGQQLIMPYHGMKKPHEEATTLDFSQVIGQEAVKRALVIAVSGRHGVLMIGGPGCGKTMMARRIPTIMPELTYEEQLEITGIYSVAGLLEEGCEIITKRPFRCPHSSISAVGLTGGGSARVRPGELSLAHTGVLFLDELGEFDNRAIDSMRLPLEEGVVRINRNSEEIIFPSRALIIIASNPCKCGNLWNPEKMCTCSARQIESHQRKLMGPFADRIDMHIKINPVSKESIEEGESRCWESSESMRKQVELSRAVQKDRYAGSAYTDNGSLDEEGIGKYCKLTGGCRQMLQKAYESMNLTMRAYNKVVKIARTIADIEGFEMINEEHVAEALMYRIKE